MKQVVILGLVLLLAGCGGSNRFKSPGNSRTTPATVSRLAPVSYGPISKACQASDRKARSRQLCGCIQAAADQTLNSAQQNRAVAFYNNPHLAQEIRQSDRSSDERFWKAYSNYADHAKALCS
ncbi:hypothetical protein PEL8287_02650 [Roseovarius litorisediminis]|uniref:Arginine transporter n=1 Tax=Roseovarius litorisediminis TaxID=1312363 RepID=A0A1Y5SX13_9RHOB|nr:hypothetical protein [Roseovarius litorisediminis]SLN50749.1 hypothetical protein PEL8287_02650 [Roseovarius litorisediminis]